MRRLSRVLGPQRERERRGIETRFGGDLDAVAGRHRLAQPIFLLEGINADIFSSIFPGEGNNEPDAPLAKIYPRAQALALMVLTLGQPLSDRISELFDKSDYSLGVILDAVASVAADRASQFMEDNFSRLLESRPGISHSAVVLGYSPGYCGWHISAQKAFFAQLRPEEIEVRINSSYLMSPIKSISAVLVCGEPSLHRFDNRFAFCRECRNMACLDRMNRINI